MAKKRLERPDGEPKLSCPAAVWEHLNCLAHACLCMAVGLLNKRSFVYGLQVKLNVINDDATNISWPSAAIRTILRTQVRYKQVH